MRCLAIILVAALCGLAQAAIEAHHFVNSRIWGPDVMSMQVWVDGHLVCDGAESMEMISNTSNLCMRNHDGQGKKDCAPGYSWCSWDNGKLGQLEYFENSKLVWTSPVVTSAKGDVETEIECGCLPAFPDECKIAKCYWDENCLSSDGKLQKCSLCDFKANCWADPRNPPALDPPKPFPYPKKAFKALIVGDSITQGHEGDFTWRYRLWEWLRPLGDGTIFEDVDFVGPWTGTYPPAKPETAEPKPPPLMGDNPVGNSDFGPITNQGGAYNKGVNSEFPDRHLARWGLQAAQVKSQVFTAVERYSPSFLLLMIGFNDIGWFVNDADGLLKTLGEIVKGAQAVNPNLQILVANIVHRTAIGGREDLVEKTTSVNTRLPGWADEWSTDSSSVKLVDIASVYKCGTGGCPDGYDGLHPNAEGEYHIASEFSNVLVKDFAIGSERLKVPASIPVRTASVPSDFKVTAAPSGMVASWDHVFGAFGYEIRTAIGDQDWSEPIRISTNAYYYSWVRKNDKWSASVRTVMGDDIKSSWTSTQSATANPQTPRPPRNVTTSPAGSSMVVRWNPSLDSVERYGVIYYDQTDKGFAQSVGTHADYLNIDGLKDGHLYTVAVQSWNSNGGGLPQPARGVIPGSGRPLTPRLLSVKSIDNYELQLKWAADVVYTVGYRVWIRNTKDGKPATTDEYGTTTDLTYSIFFMFSPWDYEFCVTAYNGDVESPKSNCMIPEKL